MTEREPRAQYTAQQFIDAIPKTGGIISTIAARVGCDWHTAKKYIDSYPTIKQAYQDECERVLDLAETKLIEAINGGDLQAVKYILSTKGKSRGYVERQEHTGADGGPQKHEVTITDDSIIRKLLPELASDGTSGETKPAE